MEGQGLDETQGGGATVISIAQGLGLEFVPMSALHFLGGPDIARCGAANRFLYSAACNEGVWQAARDRLWEGKVFIPGSSRSLRAKEGYVASLQDSKRTWLLMEELISFSWWFRFKQQAGEAWTAQDPWYRNEKVNHRSLCIDRVLGPARGLVCLVMLRVEESSLVLAAAANNISSTAVAL